MSSALASYLDFEDYSRETAPVAELEKSYSHYLQTGEDENNKGPWEICQEWIKEKGYAVFGFPISWLSTGEGPYTFEGKITCLLLVRKEIWPEGVEHFVIGELYLEHLKDGRSNLMYEIVHDPCPNRLTHDYTLKGICFVSTISEFEK